MIGLDQVRALALPLQLFEDFSYWPELWWDYAQYDEADRYLKWPCSDFFAHSTELWNFQDMLGPDPRDDVIAVTL